jgi:hypothetical protein
MQLNEICQRITNLPELTAAAAEELLRLNTLAQKLTLIVDGR